MTESENTTLRKTKTYEMQLKHCSEGKKEREYMHKHTWNLANKKNTSVRIILS